MSFDYSKLPDTLETPGGKAREPGIMIGDHTLIVANATVENLKGWQHRIRFVVAESTTMPVGSTCDHVWWTSGINSEGAMNKLAAFAVSLLDQPDMQAIKTSLPAIFSNQLCRGVAIRCVAKAYKSKFGRDCVGYDWYHVNQDAETRRAQAEYVEKNVRDLQPVTQATAPTAAPKSLLGSLR